MTFRNVLFTIVLALCTVAAVAQLPTTYTYETIDVEGATWTRILGVNAQGDCVGLFLDGKGVRHTFVHKGGLTSELHLPGAIRTTGRSINAAGDIAGNYVDSDGNSHGFAYREGELTVIDINGPNNVFVRGIDDAGVVIGVYAEGALTANPPDASAFRIFLARAGQLSWVTAPGLMPEPFAFAPSRNDSGSIVGTIELGSQGRNYGFLVKNDRVVILAHGDAPFTSAADVSTAGIVVGTYAYLPEQGQGWIWRNGEFRDFSVDGIYQTAPRGVNARGEVVGSYFDFARKEHGFLARPVRN